MRVVEFFAGIGLVRMAMEKSGHDVVWANDIDPIKFQLYAGNFNADHFKLADIRSLSGYDVPNADIATASFPCTDVSLAGHRRGLAGVQSGMLWEFTRILDEMGSRRPPAVLLENVPSFATSNSGKDLRQAVITLNDLGYWCDIMIVDACHFIPQSRPRLFIVGWQEPLGFNAHQQPSSTRPKWLLETIHKNADLKLNSIPLAGLPRRQQELEDIVEHMGDEDPRWWSNDRSSLFVENMVLLHQGRLDILRDSSVTRWATAFRRTRNGKAVWEIREDGISGCLRAVRGGSSKQALVRAGGGVVRVRWMTRLEYARLQGAPTYDSQGVSEAQALFGFGDAVCVPAVEWIATTYLNPLFERTISDWNLARQVGLANVGT